jgi:hypothetical protein
VRRNVVVAEGSSQTVLWSMGKPMDSGMQQVRNGEESDSECDSEEGPEEGSGEESEGEDEPPPEVRRTARAHVPNRHYANAAVGSGEEPKDLTEAMAGPERDYCWHCYLTLSPPDTINLILTILSCKPYLCSRR